MASVVRKALMARKLLQLIKFVRMATTVVLVVVFALSGIVKLTPLLNAGAHTYMVTQFIVFAQVPPINLLPVDPYAFRLIAAVIELSFAAALVVGNPWLQHLLIYAMLAFLIAAIYVSAMAGVMILAGIAAFLVVVVLVRWSRMSRMKVYALLVGGAREKEGLRSRIKAKLS